MRTVLFGVLMGAVACGGDSNRAADSGAPDSTADTTVSADIGEEGGTLVGPDGATVSIPPGALPDETTITISSVTSGFTELPAVASGMVYSFEPHGLTFQLPVTITLPHTDVPEELAMYTAELGASWDKIPATKDLTELRAEVTHFSFFFNGREVCGLYRQECCVSADGPDGACAGDALTCVDNRCLECGFAGEICCGAAPGTCVESGTSCQAGVCQFPIPDAGPPIDSNIPDAAPQIPDAQPPPDAAPLPDA